MPDDNGNGNLGEGSSNDVTMQPQNESQSVNNQTPMEASNISNHQNSIVPLQNSEDIVNIVIDESVEDRNLNQVDPSPPANDFDLDVNIELVNQEILGPQLDFDADAEEFRRRFYEAISRRNAQLVESPDEDIDDQDDQIEDFIEDIIEDQEEDSFDGITTGQPSSREDRDFDSDENPLLVDREEISSVPVFDLQLPSRHSYLGEAMETLSGRTILEGGSITDIPLVLLGFHLVPGQTLPLTVFHAGTQSALRRCVPNNRHFGIVHSGLNDVNIRTPLPRRALGTTAEIYEFQEERQPEPHSRIPPSVNIKAKGRHRFNVLSTYRQSDGHLYAKVKIRPEISLLRQPWRNVMSSGHRHMFPTYPFPSSNVLQSLTDPNLTCSTSTKERIRRRSENSNSNILIKSQSNSESGESNDSPPPNPSSSSTDSIEKVTDGAITPAKSFESYRKINRYYSAMTGWPYFVYEQFDENVFVERLHRKINSELSTLTTASVALPRDPTDLSFWLAQNLTMSDSLRLQMLKMDTPIERLRFASKLMDKVSRVISCKECQAKIADHEDIFSMSIEGPQGTYVNPHGVVHELITVTKIRGAVHRGPPSTESSWFPGFAWTVLECRVCHEHLGWKFKAEERLKPSRFWGLARRSVSFKYDFSLDNDCPDLDTVPPQPPSNPDSVQSDHSRRRESEGHDSSASSNFSLALI